MIATGEFSKQNASAAT